MHSHGIAQSKYYGAITKRMNFNCPVAETSEGIEPNDNNLELNAIAYIFSKIDSNLNFNITFGDRELLASVSLLSPQRRTRKLKKRTLAFSAVEDSTLLRWHSGTQKRVGKIDKEGRLLWKSIVKTKHQSLTSLAFIPLAPGADRVVRHICIRCLRSVICPTIAYWRLRTKENFKLLVLKVVTGRLREIPNIVI